MNKIKQTLFLTIFILALIVIGRTSVAEEFMGVEIEVGPATYIVLRNVNVRSRPETKSKRLKGLKKGNKVQSTGYHQGWITIIEEGKPVGFAYKKFLLPLIDGSLEKDVTGMTKVAGRFECNYQLVYAGRSDAGNEVYKMADYDINAICKVNGRKLEFSMFMFMTEGPSRRSRPSIHQITVDILQFEYMEDYDDVFSTIVYYDHVKHQIVYDGASLPDLVSPPEQLKLDARSVEEALSQAVAMTFGSWKPKAWKELAKALN